MAKKQSSKAEKNDTEYYFISVHNPLETRRQLLESTKKSIYCLQHYHRILLIRKKKQEEVAWLEKSWKEIDFLNKKLSEKVPSYNDSILGNMKREKSAPIMIKVENKPKAPAEKTELELLEQSLSAIENKLKNLN